MGENRASGFISGISKGFYRIALVITFAIVVIGLWNVFGDTVQYSTAYRFGILEPIPSKVSNCTQDDIKFTEWGATTTPKGGRVNLDFCFQKMEVVSAKGDTFNGVPYKKTDKGLYFVDESPSKYGSQEGDKYVIALMKKFSIPSSDLQELDKGYWGQKLSSIGTNLLYLLGGLLGWGVFCLVVRFIWRGFTNRDD